MSRILIATRFLLMGLAACGLAKAQDDPPAEVEKQLAALIAEQNALADQYNAIIRRIKQSEPIVKLDEAITAAAKELADAESADEAVAAARSKLAAAQADFKSAVETKLADHPEARKLQERLAELRESLGEYDWAVEHAQFQLTHPLSPISRALAGDAELNELKRAMDRGTVEERSAATAAYEKLRIEKIALLETGKKLLAEIEQAEAGQRRTAQAIVSLEERLLPIRREMEAAEKQAIKDAQAALDAALAAEPLKKLRLARNEAVKAYNAAVNEAIGADPKAGGLKKQYEAIAAKVKELKPKN